VRGGSTPPGATSQHKPNLSTMQVFRFQLVQARSPLETAKRSIVLARTGPQLAHKDKSSGEL
jgi:hypothetical protein